MRSVRFGVVYDDKLPFAKATSERFEDDRSRLMATTGGERRREKLVLVKPSR